MFTQFLVLGLQKVSCIDGVSRGYTLGKKHQGPFLKRRTLREITLIKLVHRFNDFFNSGYFSGTKYVLNFIDDLSWYSWVYFLKYKR